MERRSQVQERRTSTGVSVPAERRGKPRRKLRKFAGSPPASQIHIDVSDEDVVRYWAQELDVSAEDLKAIVGKAGPTVQAVREYLGK